MVRNCHFHPTLSLARIDVNLPKGMIGMSASALQLSPSPGVSIDTRFLGPSAATSTIAVRVLDLGSIYSIDVQGIESVIRKLFKWGV